MTVKDLRRILKDFPSDLEVAVVVDGCSFHDIGTVELRGDEVIFDTFASDHDQAMYMEEHSYGWKINDSQLNNLRLEKVSELWDEDGNRFTLDELECINDGTRGDVALGNYAGPYYYSDPTQD